MFDFGDEVIVGGYRIPWLIWIQLVVMFLLIILLYYFTLFAFDLSEDNSSSSAMAASTSSSPALFTDKPTTTTAATNCLQNLKVGESQSIKGEIATSTSRSRRMVRGEDILEGEGITISENSYHPCYYIRLAREAFLKCLGLDCIFDKPSTREQSKED